MSDQAYRKYMGRAELEKAINSLLGLIEGITIDSKINEHEIGFLNLWLEQNKINADKHPFNELFPVVEDAISDGVLSEDEKEDISWLCKKITSSDYFNVATADMQKLHAVVAAIAADGEITQDELNGLSSWLQEHDHLKTCWPYDEIESLITSIMQDGRIDPDEHKILVEFFGEFVSLFDNKTVVSPLVKEGNSLLGLSAVCPDINFEDAVFCLTGTSYKYSRVEFEKLISDLGGTSAKGVSKKVNYLIVGADGNPCWAYACYGRKVEKAVELRKQGVPIVIVHENDFHDAAMDA